MIGVPGDWELIGRLALAALLGGVVGIERELRAKEAGLRSLSLVALGAAGFTVAGYAVLTLPQATELRPDPARIAAQVVTGIGFFGAGIIVFTGGRVKGLTTAADVWLVAAIGVLCGLGLVAVAAAGTAIGVLVVVGLRPVDRWLEERRPPPDQDDSDTRRHGPPGPPS